MNREQEIKEEIKKVFLQVRPMLEGYKVVLFGSRAKGTARQYSDFDVGIIGDRNVSPKLYYTIDDLLDKIDTLYSIDWVDLNETTPQFRKEAMKYAELIYG